MTAVEMASVMAEAAMAEPVVVVEIVNVKVAEAMAVGVTAEAALGWRR